jgi:hypothetical protein
MTVMLKSPRYDTQRNEVYEWERQLSSSLISPTEARSLTHRIEHDYGLTAIKLSLRTSKLGGVSYGGRVVIHKQTNKGLVCQELLLHELAHEACAFYRLTRQSHDRDFCLVFAELLIRYGGYTRGSVLRSLRSEGLI